ncbi:hypothetical protein COK68_29750 [Priestia megaterium]|nr:IS6 family transposase [Priestia megaterium]PFT48382.1 hypothetical protein COK68_29750 [Priestia megaterium]
MSECNATLSRLKILSKSIRVKCQWKYLYRAVDLEGNTTNFYLIKTRYHKTAKRFSKRALQSFYILNTFAIKLDKN